MPDKVPLGRKVTHRPDPDLGEDDKHVDKPKRGKKSQFQVNRDRAKLWDEITGYLRLITLIAIGVGGYLFYRYVNDPEYMRNDRFAIMEKIIVEPTKFKDHHRTTSLGASSSMVYPPKYVFKCLGDNTRDHYFVLVDENSYYDVPLRTILNITEVERYTIYNSMADLNAHYAGIETAPAAEVPTGSDNQNAILDQLMNMFSR